ncbi:MAG: dihydroorotase family protein [Candidatus Thorarchaeota archaeon]
MAVDLVLKDGIFIENGRETVRSVAIEAGKIEGIFKQREEPKYREVIDCRGLYILPGLIDIHVHLRDLNQADKEDFVSGTMAAAAGGVTTVVDMPNSDPPVLSKRILDEKIARANESRYVNVGFYAGIPHNIEDFDVQMINDVLGLKVYPHSPLDKETKYNKNRIRDCMKLTRASGIPLLFHPELPSDNKIPQTTEEFFLTHSCESEVNSLQAFIDAKIEYEAKLHVCHVSCAATTRLILENRAEDTLTAEVTPHHLFLSGGDFPHEDGSAKMLPPLRSPYDNRMLLEALTQKCAIDCVATDHAPHKKWEKTAPFLKAASGIPGLETLLPIMLTEVFEKRMSWIDYLRVCCSAPARILGLETKGILTKGYDADIVLARIQEGIISGKEFKSKAKITPFEGRRVLARTVTTIVGGEVVFRDGKFVLGPGIGGMTPVRKS